MSDIDIIKKILFKLFVVNESMAVLVNPFITLDIELLELLKELKGK